MNSLWLPRWVDAHTLFKVPCGVCVCPLALVAGGAIGAAFLTRAVMVDQGVAMPFMQLLSAARGLTSESFEDTCSCAVVDDIVVCRHWHAACCLGVRDMWLLATSDLDTFLFCVRLAARMEGHATLAMERVYENEDPTAGAIRSVTAVPALTDFKASLGAFLRGPARDLMQKWVAGASAANNNSVCARVHAHLVLVTSYQTDEMTLTGVTSVLSSMAYVLAWHSHGVGMETDGDEHDLMVSEQELFLVLAVRVPHLVSLCCCSIRDRQHRKRLLCHHGLGWFFVTAATPCPVHEAAPRS